MHRKNNVVGKIVAIILFIISIVMVPWLILDGSKFAYDLLEKATRAIEYKEIDRVALSIDVDEPLLAGKTISIRYVAKNADGETVQAPGLQFKSLDKDILSVTSQGSVKATMAFEGEELTASYQITSLHNSSFKQIVTLRFIKVYPDDFTVHYYSLGLGGNAKTLYVGAPISMYANVKTKNYNVETYEILYDETYFTYDADTKKLTPICATPVGETLKLGIRYVNGNTEYSPEFSIAPIEQAPSEFDEVWVGNRVLNNYDGLIGDIKGEVKLYKDGKRVYMPFKIALRDADGKIPYVSLSYTKPGEKQVTITMYDGYSQTLTFHLHNIISLPTITLPLDENGTLHLKQYETKHYSIKFENEDQTYFKIKSSTGKGIVRIEVDEDTLTLYANAPGETTVTLYIDDGEQRVETSFRVEIEANGSLAEWIKHNETEVKPKIGHFGLFMFYGFVVFNLFCKFRVKNKDKLVLLHAATAWPMAFYTEIMQLFMDGRSSRLSDVGIDLLGFYLGTLIAFLVWKFVSTMRNELDEKRRWK